jgi:hypothetical protein
MSVIKHGVWCSRATEFESKDCLPRMKIRMVSIIFVGIGLLNLTSTGLTEAENVNFVFSTYVILTEVSVPSEMLEPSISLFNC